jgi:hypothetical protein
VLKANYVGRIGRKLLAQADANQIIDFADPASGQLLSVAFASVTTQLRAGGNSANLVAQPWFENQIPINPKPYGYPNKTSLLADNIGGLGYNGDFADTVQALTGFGVAPNVGMAAQFSENTFYTNKGFSSYNGLLVTLSRNLANGFVCDVIRPYACYGNSDFDVKHYVTGDLTYNLPVGRGKMLAGKSSLLVDELIGGWSVSTIVTAHTGNAFGTVSNAFVAGYANDAPALLVGNKSAVQEHTHKVGSQVFLFADQTAADNAFTGPVGFQIGARNNLRGPGFFNEDAGLAKIFPILPDRHIALKFRADAFNVFNHPSFAAPGEASAASDITNSNFGILSSTSSTARVMQFVLRLEF